MQMVSIDSLKIVPRDVHRLWALKTCSNDGVLGKALGCGLKQGNRKPNRDFISGLGLAILDWHYEVACNIVEPRALLRPTQPTSGLICPQLIVGGSTDQFLQLDYGSTGLGQAGV